VERANSRRYPRASSNLACRLATIVTWADPSLSVHFRPRRRRMADRTDQGVGLAPGSGPKRDDAGLDTKPWSLRLSPTTRLRIHRLRIVRAIRENRRRFRQRYRSHGDVGVRCFTVGKDFATVTCAVKKLPMPHRRGISDGMRVNLPRSPLVLLALLEHGVRSRNSGSRRAAVRRIRGKSAQSADRVG
jgi:hypothetical protein